MTRTRFEVALWIRARDALRARGLYRASSHRYGDPAAWMMPRVQWQRERAELAAIFDRPLDADERLSQLECEQRRRVQAPQDGHDRGERVLFDGEHLTGEPPGERQTRESKIARLVPAMLPTVQFAEILIDVHRDLGFLDELQHYGQGARSSARQGQLVAALLADIFGVSYAQMALACGYTERQMREAAQRHLTEENLDAANTVIVQALRLMPHEWIAEVLMTSSDAQRYEIIGRSPLGAFAARHTGHRQRMLSWLLWLTGEYAHFGGKIIPVTEPESWHTLDALVHFDGPTEHTTGTHGTTELTFGISDLLGRDFVPRLDDFTNRRRYRIGDAQPWLAADALLTHTARRELIREQYEELQRIAGSIKRGPRRP